MHYCPRVLALLLPANLTFYLGAVLIVFASFSAFVGVYILRDPAILISSLIEGFSGSWLLLVPFAAMRDTVQGEEILNRTATMLASVVGVLFLGLYIRSPSLLAMTHLWLVLFGAVVILRPSSYSSK